MEKPDCTRTQIRTCTTSIESISDLSPLWIHVNERRAFAGAHYVQGPYTAVDIRIAHSYVFRIVYSI
jgi:hypothetical protein